MYMCNCVMGAMPKVIWRVFMLSAHFFFKSYHEECQNSLDSLSRMPKQFAKAISTANRQNLSKKSYVHLEANLAPL